ncbi:MAG: 4-alpha-glucanotransferase [Acholeplasmatales bacterium]|nr:4-alpha-glucanotransferase [Acholeplasmatales bacterium]
MRKAGVLLHISSLPTDFGVGSMGKDAYKFVDFLAEGGNKVWQILPVGPTSYGDSPYQALSAFAFSPYFIDLDMLVEEGLLMPEELPQRFDARKVNYEELFNTRMNVLLKTFDRREKYQAEFEKFCAEEDYWLDNYAIYSVLKKEHSYKPWVEWYDDFKYRRPASIVWVRNEFNYKIQQVKFVQFLAFKQYMALKKYANSKGIEIMGDMPIYCAYDSSDVWAEPTNFKLDENLNPTFVAGCPPDGFSPDGQLWGNPLYNWDKMREDKFSWWVNRINHSKKLFDIVRIDHFRGFEAYYAIPFGDTTARNGHWEKGPDYALFEVIKAKCKGAKIVAENLGFLTQEVNDLMDKCGYPGMKIFQFELGGGDVVPLKEKYDKNNIFYTGTHDNMTLMSYYNTLNDRDKKIIDDLCKIGFYDKPNLKIIEFAMKTNCDYCIIPLQDYLGLSDEDRMNIPSTSGCNWQYISRRRDYTPELKEFMAKVIKESKR